MCVYCPQESPDPGCPKCHMCRIHCECYGRGEARYTEHLNKAITLTKRAADRREDDE